MGFFNNDLFNKKNLTNPKIYKNPYDCVIANPDTQLFLCIGDSLTAMNYGYHQVIQDNLRNLGYSTIVVNRGAESGYRIGDIYGAKLDGYLDLFPNAKVFTVLLGTNDTKTTLNWFSYWQSKFYYYHLIHRIFERVPDAVVRICQIPWISPSTTDSTFLPNDTWEINKDKINQLIRSLARHFGMPEAPDLYTITTNQTDWFNDDGLHFSLKGYRNVAPIFTNLIKQQPTYTADENFLVGKSYSISGANISTLYSDDGYKLTKGRLASIKEVPTYSDGNGVGFSSVNNGGFGTTINVNVDFYFGEEITINDVIALSGASGQKYGADSIAIYSYDGLTYILKDTLTNSSEGYISATGLEWWNMYTPATPFKTKGLRLVYTKTFTADADWLFIREIGATRLSEYNI